MPARGSTTYPHRVPVRTARGEADAQARVDRGDTGDGLLTPADEDPLDASAVPGGEPRDSQTCQLITSS